jgi:hypothetical protein
VELDLDVQLGQLRLEQLEHGALVHVTLLRLEAQGEAARVTRLGEERLGPVPK